MEACGAFWPEANNDAEKMATLAEAGHTVVGFEAVSVPFDITAEAQFFGCEIKDGTMEKQPSVVGHVVKTIEDIDKLKGYDLSDGMIGSFSLAQHINGDEWFMAIFTDEAFGLVLMESSGIEAISVDQNVDAAAAVANVEKAVIVGNFDPVNMLWKQTPETIREESQKIIDAGIGLLAPRCGTVGKTPIVNLQAMIEMSKSHKY